MSTATSTRYADALARLYALQSRGMRFGANRMASALALRGHPERGLRFVHVAGTNGKGSVSAMIEASLRAAGYRTGLFTSPHMHRFVERVRIAGRPIGDAEAGARVRDVLAASAAWGEPESTFFELTTLLALESFRDHRCDVVVLETGLGGRLDATNAIVPEVSVITTIALEHTEILGKTHAAIAREKAGILKPGVAAVVGVREPAARRVIARRARVQDAPLLLIDRDFAPLPDARAGRFVVRAGEHVLGGLRLALPGAHQQDNAACAVTALLQLRARGFDVSDDAVRKGLARVRWPARLERVARKPTFLFDAAHNPEGAQVLATFLQQNPGSGPRVLIFGAFADKDYAAMLRVLRPHVDRIVYCPPPVWNAATNAALRRCAAGIGARDVADALARARRLAGSRGEIIVAGSIYLVAAARARVLGLRSDPPIRM
jgi:dihydrofolate synthase/folylpolyglutamate synthase